MRDFKGDMQDKRRRNHQRLYIEGSCPPLRIRTSALSISKLMQSLKGKTSYKLLSEYKELSKQFWGRHIWGRGYFAAAWGNVTDEVIMEYISTQNLQENDGDFQIAP